LNIAKTIGATVPNLLIFPGGSQKDFSMGANSGEISFHQVETKRKKFSKKKLIGKYNFKIQGALTRCFFWSQCL